MKGQGMIEAIYSLGVLGLILTGAVVLILLTTANKKSDFDRKRAVELGTLVMEETVGNSKIDPNSFWILQNQIGVTRSQFEGYSYDIGFTNITNDANYPNCGGVGIVNCAEVVVQVNWQGKNPQSILFNRFFSKDGN